MLTYSPRNTERIVNQRPDAQTVKTYRQWQAEGRQVRKGEKGIRIYRPILKGDDRTRYKPVAVFDISQTDPMTRCLDCQTPAYPSDKFCAECGGAIWRLEQSETQPAPPAVIEPVPVLVADPTIAVAPKHLAAELKPVCAGIRKHKPAERRRNPLLEYVRVQASPHGMTAAPLLDSTPGMGAYPNPAAPIDVLLDLDNAYALATLPDPKKPLTITVETVTIEGYSYVWDRAPRSTGPCLVVSQPSSVPGRTDTMRFTTITV